MKSEITGISSMATRRILADLVGPCEERTGCRLAMKSVGGVNAARMVRAGEPVDVVVLASQVIEELETEGHIVRGSWADFARSGIAVAVPADKQEPSIKDEESVKQAILQARKICYSSGPSGEHLKQLWQRWGIAGIIAPRIMQAPAGVPVGGLLAAGEADIGFQQLSELLDLPGIRIIGPLPAGIQAVTVFSAGVCKTSTKREEAQAVVAYLASRDAEPAKRKHGMEPA